jgi:hypothetical protein
MAQVLDLLGLQSFTEKVERFPDSRVFLNEKAEISGTGEFVKIT